jgi:hypothetical protein
MIGHVAETEERAVPCAATGHFVWCVGFSGVELRWSHRLQVCVPFLGYTPLYIYPFINSIPKYEALYLPDIGLPWFVRLRHPVPTRSAGTPAPLFDPGDRPGPAL